MAMKDDGTPALHDVEARIAALEAALRDKAAVETRLRESEERLALVLAGTNDGWWDWNLETGEMYFSPRWWQIAGYAPGELPATQETWRRLAHPDDAERVNQAYLAALRGGAGHFAVESRRKHKDGRWVTVLTRGKVLVDVSGKPVRIAGTTTDLTERERDAAALLRSEERFRTIVELTIVGVWELDSVDRTTFVNQRAGEMLGYESRDMLGRPVEDFLFPEDVGAHREALRRRHQGRRDSYERRMRRKDGSAMWVIVSATSLRGAGGEFLGSFATLTDITERKEMEAARAAQVEELRRWYGATLGRERRIAELKEEVNALSDRLGVPRPYADPAADASSLTP